MISVISNRMPDSGGKCLSRPWSVFTASVRHYLGAYFASLNGATPSFFTGGIGEILQTIRSAVCAELDWLELLWTRFAICDAKGEVSIHSPSSRVHDWINAD